MIQLNWRASVSASTIHAVWALISGQKLTDARVAAALAPSSDRLQTLLDEQFGDDRPRREIFGEHLVALSAGIENNRQLVELAFAKALGAGQVPATRLAEWAAAVGDAERAMLETVPGLADQLALRGEPLRQLWEARGPGMLLRFGQLTEPELIAPRAEVVLVLPVRGGGGAAHLSYNAVRIEAVLANPFDALPEVVRLGWLLAQLQCDLPRYSEHLPQSFPLRRLAALATLPPILLAAEEVELAPYSARTVELALAMWLGEAAGTAAVLTQWWETYAAMRPRWGAALGALGEMLAAAGCHCWLAQQ